MSKLRQIKIGEKVNRRIKSIEYLEGMVNEKAEKEHTGNIRDLGKLEILVEKQS